MAKPKTPEPHATAMDPPEPEPGQPPAPGTIVRAYDYGDYFELIVVYTGETEQVPFVLRSTDHYGDSDAWRAEYERALAAGEITPEPPPPEPEPEPQT